MKGKQTMVFALAAAMALGSTMTAFAGQWMEDDVGYWWQEDDGSYPVDTMKWIDADGDTVSEGYYFDENGYVYDCMSRGPNMTLEEYMNAQMPRTSAETTHHGEGYDPAHPLAGKVDEWNLRLVETDWDNRIMGTVDTIASWNVHDMLTGQMDQYLLLLLVSGLIRKQERGYIPNRKTMTMPEKTSRRYMSGSVIG